MEIDYEKEYAAMVQRARELHETGNELTKRQMEIVCPELRESEDERHRKWILEYLYDGLQKSDEQFKDQFKSAISWLEKQKESLHIEKTCKENADSFTDEDERIRKGMIRFLESEQAEGIFTHEARLSWISYLERQKEIPLMNGDADLYFDEWNQQKPNPTKRQCFEEGMKYAQRLQKEQKLTEWSEFDKGALEDAICATDMLGNDESFNKSNPNLAKAFRVAKDWLKSLPLNLKKKNEDVAKLCSNEWSEEDESQLDDIEKAISNYYDLNHAPQYHYWLEEKLKSLRPQITNSAPLYTIEQVDEKVREAQEWKPGKEQMEALNALNCHGDLSYAGQQKQLISLYNDLKKLM